MTPRSKVAVGSRCPPTRWIGGGELAARTYRQARRLGAEFLIGAGALSAVAGADGVIEVELASRTALAGAASYWRSESPIACSRPPASTGLSGAASTTAPHPARRRRTGTAGW